VLASARCDFQGVLLSYVLLIWGSFGTTDSHLSRRGTLFYVVTFFSFFCVYKPIFKQLFSQDMEGSVRFESIVRSIEPPLVMLRKLYDVQEGMLPGV